MIETERKFLIEFPDVDFLVSLPDCKTKKITQTYLKSDNSSTRRVRLMETDGKKIYFFTEKRRISSVSCYEDEREITEEEYFDLMVEKDTTRETILKTRYAFPFRNHIIEVDVYDFWSKFATLEIELSDETEGYEIPPFISVIKEVTDDKRFKNAYLALNHNFDPLA